MEDSVEPEVLEAESEAFIRRAHQEMADFKPAELMDWIANGAPEDQLRMMAIAALHGQVQPWLEHRVKRLRDTYPGTFVSEEDLIGETWLRIVKGAASYQEPPGCQNPIGNLFRWTSTIMRNTLFELRKRRFWEPLSEIPDETNAPPERTLPMPFGHRRASPPSRPELVQMLRECIKGLRSKQQQLVLSVSADYYEFCPKRGKMVCEPPDAVRARLSEELGSADNNICKLRERALNNVRACITNKLGKES